MYKEEFKSDDLMYKIIVGRNSKENWGATSCIKVDIS